MPAGLMGRPGREPTTSRTAWKRSSARKRVLHSIQCSKSRHDPWPLPGIGGLAAESGQPGAGMPAYQFIALRVWLRTRS